MPFFVNFNLIDKNHPLYKFSSLEINDVFHELLTKVDSILFALTDSGVSYENLNFDNLECIEARNDTNNPHIAVILNRYRFSISEMAFVNVRNIDDKYFLNPKHHGEIVFQIKDKLNKPKTKKSKKITIVKPDVPRPMNSVLVEDTNNLDNISPETLKKTIDELENLKKQEEEKLKELEEINEKDTNKFSDFCDKLGDAKREYRRNKEMEEEKKKKFEANKCAYRKMRQHLIDGKITENDISPLFKKEYPIYKFMDEKDLLDKPDEYILYLNMYDELYPEKNEKSDYIPHNVNYLSAEEKKKYLDMKTTNQDIIEEFIYGQPENNLVKKYPSLNEILEKVGDSDNENYEGISFDDNNKQTKQEENLDMMLLELAKSCNGC
ncbi:hypothetical protein Indivirus_1_126 [Indivirus ILV1]|uniref:Uncharacterized protein n=1 Tax=Indivirus ILV1 TaxID=1977633 RepID=A0A1V0SCQ9_9VIRU|nr:hypothetical protein Indivirus_1_126 [Indivirus ILV1]